MKTFLGDATSLTVGYTAVDPQVGFFSSFGNMLLSIVPAPTAVDEIIRLVASLILTVLSRFVYAWLDRRFEKKQPAAAPKAIPVPDQPQKLIIDNSNEKDSKKKSR